MMTCAEIFEALGGREAVMRITGQSRNSVNHWLNDGIPWRHFPALKAAAAAQSIAGITDETLAASRPDARPRTRRRKAA
jgi:hypothetical protein